MTQFQGKFRLERAHLQQLFDALTRRGYQVVGPTLRDRAIVYDQLNSVADLPMGWTDEQDGGIYRLKKRDDEALFGFTVGPHSWKQFLHPPERRLWRAERLGNSFDIIPEDDEQPKYAFIGVRSCDLSAIAVQDRVLLHDRHTDPIYQARREDCFIVAVNCGQADGGRRDGFDGRARRAMAQVGFMLDGGFHLHSRRQHARDAETALPAVDDAQTKEEMGGNA